MKSRRSREKYGETGGDIYVLMAMVESISASIQGYI